MSDGFDDYLSRNERAFVAACKSIIHNPAPEGAAYGLFWFQVDDTIWEHLPIALAWCDHDHGCEVQYPSPVTSIATGVWSPPQELDDSAIGGRVFRWIYRCWNTAGGTTFPIPFYCHNYHTMEHFCLRRARYVNDQEISADIEPTA